MILRGAIAIRTYDIIHRKKVHLFFFKAIPGPDFYNPPSVILKQKNTRDGVFIPVPDKAIFSSYVVRTRCEYRLGGKSAQVDILCSKWYIIYCWRTREGPIDSQKAAAEGSFHTASNAGP